MLICLLIIASHSAWKFCLIDIFPLSSTDSKLESNLKQMALSGEARIQKQKTNFILSQSELKSEEVVTILHSYLLKLKPPLVSHLNHYRSLKLQQTLISRSHLCNCYEILCCVTSLQCIYVCHNSPFTKAMGYFCLLSFKGMPDMIHVTSVRQGSLFFIISGETS